MGAVGFKHMVAAPLREGGLKRVFRIHGNKKYRILHFILKSMFEKACKTSGRVCSVVFVNFSDFAHFFHVFLAGQTFFLPYLWSPGSRSAREVLMT